MPRISATYTVSPDTVLRASAGRYAQQPQNYEIQYNTLQPNLASTLLGFIPFGYSSPLHEAQAQFSDNYDLSFEHHFKGHRRRDKAHAVLSLGDRSALRDRLIFPAWAFRRRSMRAPSGSTASSCLITKGDFSKNGFSGHVFVHVHERGREMGQLSQ